MPYHVINLIEFPDSVPLHQMKELYEKALVNHNGKLHFDFNAFAPVPKSYDLPYEMDADISHLFAEVMHQIDAIQIASTNTDPDVHAIWERFSRNEGIYLRREICEAGFNPEVAADIKRFAKTRTGEKYLEEGKRVIENIELHGAPTRYDWCCVNWGTKRNSSDNVIDLNERRIQFLTVWSAPFPIIQKMSSAFPEIPFTWKYSDAECPTSVGICEHQHHQNTLVELDDESADAIAVFRECWEKISTTKKRKEE